MPCTTLARSSRQDPFPLTPFAARFGGQGRRPGGHDAAQGEDAIMDPTCGMSVPVAASKTKGKSVSVPIPGNPHSKCGYNYVPFSNAIDPTTRNKIYVTAESDINEDTIIVNNRNLEVFYINNLDSENPYNQDLSTLSDKQINQLKKEFIQREVLVREAKRLGLDKIDSIISARLAPVSYTHLRAHET